MGKMAAAMAISLHSLVPCIFGNEYKVKLLKMFTREQERRQYLLEDWRRYWNTVADVEDADWTSIFENEYKVKLLKMFIREQQRRQDLQESVLTPLFFDSQKRSSSEEENWTPGSAKKLRRLVSEPTSPDCVT